VSTEGICAVCGRTFLVGEQVHSFVSAEGRHEVCELCADRAAELGWLPADQEGAEETLRTETERKPGFLGKLFGTRERSEDGERGGSDDREEPEDHPASAPVPPVSAAPRRDTHELETERYDVEAGWRDEAKGTDLPSGPSADLPAPPRADPAGRGMRPRRLQPDLSPGTRFERAIARFNGGDAGRTAAGLTRTLGAPSVSVGDLAGAEDVVRITVAWELTWYQWGVDLGDELRPVFELEKGYEVSEIDAAARQWNASAQDGRIVMVAPRRREAEHGRPVHR
jgi:hypothetical protein